MAARTVLPQRPESYNSVAPRSGVITLYGYGIQARVDRGHLLLEDGIGSDRHYFRLSRVGHGLKRLVIVGSDGMVSLAALRWLADQDAAFVMLDRDGTVLATTGPVRPSDARLRRAQAMALQNGAALQITRELISKKLAGQERVARKKLLDSETARCHRRVSRRRCNRRDDRGNSPTRVPGASAYWAAWRDLPITFPKPICQECRTTGVGLTLANHRYQGRLGSPPIPPTRS